MYLRTTLSSNLHLRWRRCHPTMDIANTLELLDSLTPKLLAQQSINPAQPNQLQSSPLLFHGRKAYPIWALGANFAASCNAASSISSGSAMASTIPSSNASLPVHLCASRSILRATCGRNFSRGRAPIPSKCKPRLTGGMEMKPRREFMTR